MKTCLYEKHGKFQIAESACEEYYRQIHSWICPGFEAKKFAYVSEADHIDEFYRMKMQKDSVNAKTVHGCHANIRKTLQRAVKLDSIPSNPADKAALPKARKFRGSYYTPEELKQLFACGKGTKLEAVVLLAVKTFGQRAGRLTA